MDLVSSTGWIPVSQPPHEYEGVSAYLTEKHSKKLLVTDMEQVDLVDYFFVNGRAFWGYRNFEPTHWAALIPPKKDI